MLFINYKNSPVPFIKKRKYTTFCDCINQSLSKYFKIDNSEQDLDIFSDKDFSQLLNDISEAFNSQDWEDLESLLLTLLDQFSIKNEIVQYRCKDFQQYICSKLMKIIDDHSIYAHMIPPIILQIFINILSNEDENHEFAKFNIREENRGIEIIMHLKKTLPKRYMPLIIIYAFNIYPECSKYIIEETTELYDYVKFDINDPYNFLYPLAMINLLRNEEIPKDRIPKKFISTLVSIVKISESNFSIFSMWCLYFFFKNSYKNATIKKSLIKLLKSKILSMDSLIETKIALYIFSFCYLADNETKKLICIQKTPIKEIMELINSDEKEISALSIALCNNYIIARPSCLYYFVNNGGFDIICEIAKNGPLNCKIEAGMTMLTIFSSSNSEELQNFLNPDTLLIIVDLLQINDEELNIAILSFIRRCLPTNEWVVEFLLSENFIDDLYSLRDNSDSFVFHSVIEGILKVFLYKKIEFESQ